MAVTREELEFQARAKLEISRRKREEKFRYFFPNEAQEQFINLVGSNKYFINMLAGGNGIGKSALLINILANICYGASNPWFKGDIFRWADNKGEAHERAVIDLPLFTKWPYPKKGRIISDTTTIKEKLILEIEKWFPKGRYSYVKAGKEYFSQYTTATGFSFSLMSYEQDVREFESVELGFTLFDEPPRQDIFKATVRGAREGGIIIMAFTPTLESDCSWIKDELIDKDGLANKNYVKFVVADVEKNCYEHSLRGRMPHSQIEKMLSMYNQWDREAREKGNFVHMIGRIFKDEIMRDGVQFIESFPIPKHWNKFRSIDWGYNNPTACIFLAIDPDDNWYVYGEHCQNRLTPQEQSELIKLQSNNDFYRFTLIDPSTDHDIGDGAKTVRRQFSDSGIPTQLGRNEPGARWGGISKIIEMLIPDPKTSKPKLRIFNTCKQLRWEMGHYITHQYKHPLDKNPKEEPRKKEDHLVDALRYLTLRNPHYFSDVLGTEEDN